MLRVYKTSIIHKLVRCCLSFTREPGPVQFDALTAHLVEHLDKKITLEDMAGFVNMSVSHFTRRFKEYAAVSPMEYLNQLRLKRAKRLLKSSAKNITEIAFACGYTSSSYFSAMFIKSVAITPSQHRKRFQ